MEQKKFYIIKPAVNNDEVGKVFPSVECIDNYNFESQNSIYKLRSEIFPDFIPDIRLRLSTGANPCDVMNQAVISVPGLLITPRLKVIFQKFDIVPHKYFAASIEKNGTQSEYCWIGFVWNDGINHLDFRNSKFKIKKIFRDLDEIVVKDYFDLLQKQSELEPFKVIYNYQTTMINVKYDLFIHPLNHSIYISENLFNALRIERITGLDFSNAENLLVR
jgi:hypothetical protein